MASEYYHSATRPATPQTRPQPPQPFSIQPAIDFFAPTQPQDRLISHPQYHLLRTSLPPVPLPPQHHLQETSMKPTESHHRKNTTKSDTLDDNTEINCSAHFQHPFYTPSNSFTSTAPRNVLIKTKFPVARIKRIMQADEDVGKVAQVTPVVVSKALELFMIALCDKASDQARQRHSKRITAGHLKQAIIHEEQFDFLADIIEKVPDISQPTDGSTLTNGNVDSEDGNPVKKIRKPRQRKTKGEDAFLHKTGAHRMD